MHNKTLTCQSINQWTNRSSTLLKSSRTSQSLLMSLDLAISSAKEGTLLWISPSEWVETMRFRHKDCCNLKEQFKRCRA